MEGLVIGLDLNDDYSQISCNEKEKSWTVPTVICRRKEKETWLIGEEAYAATLFGEGVIVDKLLKMVRKEGTSTIGGICYTGTDLLKIFLKKLLDCPFKEFHTDQVEQLLECMLIVSANEACNILAEQVSGSVDAFVGAMNEKAAALGCENTHFVNTTGLHDSQHYTSAWDLYLITAEALKHDDFLRICDMKSATIPATNLSEERVLHSTNYLISNWRALGYLDSRAHGVKTGSTSDAGHCLVSTAAEGSLSFISVVLGAESVTLPSGGTQVQSFSETSRLFDWGFENFSYQTVLEEAELVKEVSVALSKVDHVSVHPAADVELLLPKGTDPASLERTLDLESPVDAPVTEGQVLGTLSLSLEGEVLTTVDLLASHDVEASGLLLFWRNVRNFFSSTAVKVVGIALLVLAAALIVWKLTVGRRRYRYGRSVPRRRGGGYRGRRRH